MSKSVFITGVAGFIGSNLADRLLEKGYNVLGIDNFDPFYPREIKEQNIASAENYKSFKLFEGDIRDEQLIDEIFANHKIDVVVHLAAKAGVRPSIKDPREYYSVNVTGTLNILEAMKNNGMTKLVFASSSSVYGNNEKIPFAETDPVDNPISPYAATKKACELMCYVYHDMYKIDVNCLRFFTVYGRRQRPDLAIHKFTNMIMNGEELTMYGDGSTRRDYTYIDDIIDGVEAAINSCKGYEIVNLGESQTVELSYLIEQIQAATGKTAKVIMLEKQPGDVDRTFADISKARELYGYNPQTKIETGLKKFVEWKKSESGK